jgi:HAD superfamily hydrolase (TIGR01509 family)
MSAAQYAGIIFDFNGVLLWDASLQLQSWQRVAHELRGHPMTEQEALFHMHGRPNRDVLSYLAGRSITGHTLIDLTRRKESLYRDLCLDNPQTFVLSPGTEELLDELTKKAIPRTIATSSERTNLDFFIERLHLDRWFEVGQIVYDDHRRPGKPAPDMYLAAAGNLRLAPNECIVVEDAVSGLHAAHAAGIGYIVGLGACAAHRRLMSCPGVGLAIESMREFPRERLRGAHRS